MIPGDLLFFKDSVIGTWYESETEGSMTWSGSIAIILEKCKITNDILVLCNDKLLLFPCVILYRYCKKL